MSKKLQLQVPEPCHESWDKMTPVDKGRFCDSCQKAVVDFTGMSDMQLVAFFKKPSTGSLCGRFSNDQLERDIAFPKKRIPWFKYMLQICLPVFIANTKAISQGKPLLKINDTTATCTNLPGDTKEFRLGGLRLESQPFQAELSQLKNMLYGKVVNENGDPVPYASVVIKGTKKGVNSDEDGYFNIKVKPKDKFVTLVTSCIGYETNEKNISNHAGSLNEIILKMESKELSEVVVRSYPVVGRLTRYVTFGSVTVTNGQTLAVIKGDSILATVRNFFIKKSFKVYPNPAKSGSLIKIEIKNNETGEMQIGLLNLQGQLISSSVINTYEKNSIITYQLPNIIAGSYFIHITNRKSGKTQTEKIIIQ